MKLKPLPSWNKFKTRFPELTPGRGQDVYYGKQFFLQLFIKSSNNKQH